MGLLGMDHTTLTSVTNHLFCDVGFVRPTITTGLTLINKSNYVPSKCERRVPTTEAYLRRTGNTPLGSRRDTTNR